MKSYNHKSATGDMRTSDEVPAEHVTVLVEHIDPTATEPAQVPAAVANENERAVQVPPTPPPGYRPVGSPPWGEP